MAYLVHFIHVYRQIYLVQQHTQEHLVKLHSWCSYTLEHLVELYRQKYLVQLRTLGHLVQVLRQEYLVHLVHVHKQKYLVELHTLEHLVQVHRQVNLVQLRTGIINASIQAEIPGATTHTGALATRA